MIEFVTESGSVYQADTQARKIRRVSGSRTPTRNQGADSDWRDYTWLEPISEGEVYRLLADELDFVLAHEPNSGEVQAGMRVLIVWGMEGDILRRTLTSVVTSVSEMEET